MDFAKGNFGVFDRLVIEASIEQAESKNRRDPNNILFILRPIEDLSTPGMGC